MNLKSVIVNIIIVVFLVACANKSTSAGDGDEKKVLIKTEFGDMIVKLYNETPLHRDNFLKLVDEGFYNDLLFHRVIKSFMVQGGDPDSKNAPAGKRLGAGGPGYEINAEIVDGLYHKKGALSAARQGDNVNPERKSSGSQFYIVQGEVYNDEMLKQFEGKLKYQAIRTESMKLYKLRQAEVERLQREGKNDSINAIRIEIQETVEQSLDSTLYAMNNKRKELYTTIGGTPHLDGAYTVFGEVIQGLNIIDSIANVPTGPGDRPLNNVIMSMELIK